MSKATRVVIDGVSYPLDDTTAVDFSEAQSLSTAEKQQARNNIAAGDAADVTTIQTLVGNTALPTTAQTITGAIAEHETDISGIKSAIGTVPSGSNLQGEVDDLKSAVNVGYTPLTSSDFAQGNWKSTITFDADTRTIGSKTPIPVKAGDRINVLTGDLYITTFIYNSNMSEIVGRPISGYYKYTTATDIDIEYTGVIVFNVRTSDNYNNAHDIVPSDYNCTIKVYNTYAEDVRGELLPMITSAAEDASEALSLAGGLSETIESCENELYYTPGKTLEWITGLCNVGNFTTKTGDKVSRPFVLYQGETVSIATKGDGAYLFNAIAKVTSLNIRIEAGYSGGTKIAKIDTNSLKTYTHTAEEDEYIVLCGLDDPTTAVTFTDLKKFSKVDQLSTGSGILKNKAIMFFGDSLTAASTSGVIGFAQRIAEYYGMPYAYFLYDSGDGNDGDVPADYPRFTNYGKDGTCNRIMTGRTDSVLERVKRHIDEDTLIDYVLFECCANDMAQANQNKGTISASYTDTFDTTTTIGAIEETLRYLTTLGKPIRVGAFIPWTIQWQVSGWFDDYAAVFEKWGVPLFDMRKTAGFDMQHCAAHRLQYSLSSDNYSAYDATAEYNLDDKVKYGGTLYKCLANGVTNIPPTNTTYWMEVSSESADGTHLNNIGHFVVAGKIQQFLERC